MLSQHLEKLHFFVGAVRAGSIRKFALNSQHSQPNVSKAIQLLEADLETALILREKSGIVLTKAGKEVYLFAEEILEKAELTERKVKELSQLTIGGTYTLGAYSSIAIYLAPKLLRFIRRANPKMSLNVMTASSHELLKLVQSGSIDFSISVDPVPKKDLYSFELLTDSYSLYFPMEESEISSQPCIFTVPAAKDSRGKSVSDYLKEAGLENQICACGDFETAKAMVENGVGKGFLPDLVAQPLVKRQKMMRETKRKNLQSVGKHTIAFTCRKSRSDEKSIRWLISQLQSMLQSGYQ